MEIAPRRFWGVVQLAALTATAALLAHAVATAMGSYLIAPLPVNEARSIVRQAPVPEAPFARNIFCSQCRVGEEPAPLPPPPALAARSSLPLRLLAIMLAASAADSALSLAIVRDTVTGGAGAYPRGAGILGATVTAIGPTRVWLQHDGRSEFLDLDERPREDRAASAPAAARSADGIRQTSPAHFDVQRSALDRLLGDPNTLTGTARVLPEQKGNERGLRLVTISPESPLAKLGLQPGDLVVAINGLDVSAIDQALQTFTKLRSATHITVTLQRHHHPLTLDYDIC